MRVSVARFDNLLTKGLQAWRRGRRQPRSRERVFGFTQYADRSLQRGRALVSLAPETLVADAKRGRSRFFNPAGAALEMARALNQLGYTVDMVSYLDGDFIPECEYDVFVGHANVNWRQISERLSDQARRITYMSGCHWRHFEERTEACYRRFCSGRQLPRETVSVCRPIQNEDYSTQQADLVICLGEETAKTFRPVAKRVMPINNAAYLDASSPAPPEDWEQARRHFLYYGGTGNIQKGVDLLIEAFALEPTCHLHLYAPLEPEVLQAYRHELAASNIHYARPLRFWPDRLTDLMQRCAYTVLCGGFATGQSTALIGSLGYGLIPVVNREADLPYADNQVLIGANDVASVREAIAAASRKPAAWLANARLGSLEGYRKFFTPQAFRNSFQAALESVLGPIH